MTNGAIVDAATEQGATALMAAASQGHINILYALIKRGKFIKPEKTGQIWLFNALLFTLQYPQGPRLGSLSGDVCNQLRKQ